MIKGIKMKRSLQLAALASAVFAASAVSANERSSYVVSLGGHMAATAGSLSLTATDGVNSGSDSADIETSSAFGTSFKLGGVLGATKQHALYYHSLASWLDVEQSPAVTSLVGIGYTYYASPEVGGAYVEATAGLGGVTNENNVRFGDAGFGFLVGAGYEVSRNIQAGAYLSGVTDVDSFTSGGIDYNFGLNVTNIGLKVEAKL